MSRALLKRRCGLTIISSAKEGGEVPKRRTEATVILREVVETGRLLTEGLREAAGLLLLGILAGLEDISRLSLPAMLKRKGKKTV
jgi:hypothetical protein